MEKRVGRTEMRSETGSKQIESLFHDLIAFFS